MKLAPLLVALVILVIGPASATISIWQNDAGTGGDGGNWSDHPAPLRNRHGGSEGAYLAELYRYADEVDWYSFVLPASGAVGELQVDFTVSSNLPCDSVAPDTTFVARLVAPDGSTAGEPVTLEPCYSTGSIHVDAPIPGKWLLAFTLAHPGGIDEAGPLGETNVGAPESTFLHLPYAFSVACDTVC